MSFVFTAIGLLCVLRLTKVVTFRHRRWCWNKTFDELKATPDTEWQKRRQLKDELFKLKGK